MKLIIITFFLLLSIFVSGQSIETTTYFNSFDGYSFEYSSEWDSTAFTPLKEQFKVNFGVIIKPDFNDNNTGGFFMLKKSDSYGADLAIIARETQVSLKRVYPDALVIESKQKISKNGISYHLLITQIKQSGSVRITNKIQILKGESVYSFDFTCPKNGYDKLSSYYKILIDSFKFSNS